MLPEFLTRGLIPLGCAQGKVPIIMPRFCREFSSCQCELIQTMIPYKGRCSNLVNRVKEHQKTLISYLWQHRRLSSSENVVSSTIYTPCAGQNSWAVSIAFIWLKMQPFERCEPFRSYFSWFRLFGGLRFVGLWSCHSTKHLFDCQMLVWLQFSFLSLLGSHFVLLGQPSSAARDLVMCETNVLTAWKM